jgi:hypothetical protein
LWPDSHLNLLSETRVATFCSQTSLGRNSLPASGAGIHDRMFQHRKSAFFSSCSVIQLSKQPIGNQKQTFQRFFSSAALSAENLAIMEFRSANFKGTEIHVHDTDNNETVNVHYFLGGNIRSHK